MQLTPCAADFTLFHAFFLARSTCFIVNFAGKRVEIRRSNFRQLFTSFFVLGWDVVWFIRMWRKKGIVTKVFVVSSKEKKKFNFEIVIDAD